MSRPPGIWFVYRSHYEGPLSRRVRRLDAPSILAWFRRMIADARRSSDPSSVYEAELGGYVYGFGTVFEAVKENGLDAPLSIEALRALLDEHLYVEGEFLLDEHSLRVATDDDEVSLAYYFFDDEVVRASPDRFAFLLREEPNLPEGDAGGPCAPPFEPPFEPQELMPRGEGEGTTYACLLTFYDGDSIPGQTCAIPGVRLPDLASHLRSVVPAKAPVSWSKEWETTWPVEMRLLRAMIAPGQISLAPALAKCAAYPLMSVASKSGTMHLGVGAHASAAEDFERAAESLEPRKKPIVHLGEHAALLCTYASNAFGYQQWILFDDRFAAANPALAASILRYGRTWDPMEDPEPPRRAETEAERKARVFRQAVAGREAEEGAPYRPTERFSPGQIVKHAKFGRGLVQRAVDAGKIEVLFQDGARILVHAMP